MGWVGGPIRQGLVSIAVCLPPARNSNRGAAEFLVFMKDNNNNNNYFVASIVGGPGTRTPS